jgi:hypothetical protein
MKLAHVSLIVAAPTLCTLVAAMHPLAPFAGAATAQTSPPTIVAPAASLAFGELLQPGVTLAPSRRVLDLAGKRVRLSGFMAQMELPPRGGFYLTARPVHCDEAGGGTADLPPESVRVVVRSARGEEIPFLEGLLEITSELEVGNAADDEGRVSAFRLVVDRPTEANGLVREAFGPT